MKNLLLSTGFAFCFVAGEAQQIENVNAGHLQDHQTLAAASANHRYTVKTIQLPNRIELEYVEQGKAGNTPVIFLHGFTDSWHSFEPVLTQLPASVHVYVLSQRGHGNTTKPPRGYLPLDFANDLALFMDALNIRQAILVGHSMGSIIAQKFALLYPDKIKALVLIGAFAQTHSNPALREFRAAVQQLTDPVDSDFAEAFQRSTIYHPIPETYLDTLVFESLKLPAHVWNSALDGMLEADYTRLLKNFEKPTLICWGDKDQVCPFGDQQLLQATISGSQLLVYGETGHAVHWERPEQFTKDFMLFISKLNQVIRFTGFGD